MSIFNSGKRFRLLCISLVLPACTIFGQQQYTLSNLADSAYRNLPALNQKQALTNSARAAVTDVRHGFIPLLRANVQSGLGTDNSLPGSYNSFGIIPSTSSGVRTKSNMQSALGSIGILHGEYDLVDFGYRKATIQRAASYADLQSADFDRELYIVKTEVSRLYFTLLKKQAQLEIDEQNVQRYDHIFQIIHALTSSGIKPGSDSSLAKAERSKSIITFNQTLGTVNQLREQLSYYTGINSTNLMIDTLPLRRIELNLDYLSDTTHDDANPLIAYYFRQKQVYASNEKWVSKSFLPKVYLVASAWARGSSISPKDEYNSLSTGLGFQRYNYLAGLTIQYDLFDGLHKNDKLRIYHFQTEAGDYDLQQQQLALRSASTQADLSIRTNQVNLAELPVQINAAKDAYEQKMAQYKAGIISLVDLTNAAFVLYRSLNDYSETLSDWYLAQLDKAVATGNLDAFIQAIK